jgi:RNA polymerase sigma factor (TIGR02999 family)
MPATEDSATPPDSSLGADLARWRGGDAGALDALVQRLYPELRNTARRLMRDQAAQHTLQATALANEALIRMLGANADYHDRIHFLAVAARAMRQILIDHARSKSRDKRDGGQRLDLDDIGELAHTLDERSHQLADVLERLDKGAPRAARVVELHYFGGLNYEEVGLVMGISKATVDRELRFARAWLGQALGGLA